ncbi:MAG: retropepsin-like domain-containing protein [Lachnospiraceae bacterium]|nr:retropepsin-like domain-containing protein [Lachnospiraceae bacterium]
MIMSVFTEKYKKIQKKLINSAIVEYGNHVFPIKAQWDTGATGTCISKELVKKLGIVPTGMIKVHTPSGIGLMNKYMINLILNNEVRISNVTVMDSEIGNQGIDVLIGMDIITIGDFAVSNYEGRTQFSFRLPSQEHIEYHR